MLPNKRLGQQTTRSGEVTSEEHNDRARTLLFDTDADATVITSHRMAAVDANAAALGVSPARLMESAGAAVASAVRSATDPGERVTIVCGRGNNGGDGFVAARHLPDREVTVSLLGQPTSIRTPVARENWDILQASSIPTSVSTDADSIELDAPAAVVDALLGTGVSGPLREPERTAVTQINAVRRADTTREIIAVDVPTGIDADTGEKTGGTDGVAVDADRVVTFHDEKPGLSGLDADVTIAEIGIPEAAARYTGPGDLLGLDRDPASHKGENGRVLVVGGGPYAGAPALTARAALRAGADLLEVACPASVAATVQAYSPNLIVHPLSGERLTPSHLDDIDALARAADVTVLGPGLGGATETADTVAAFLESHTGRVVVDADALRVVPAVDTDAEVICTPHQGEFEKMGGETAADPTARAARVRAFADEIGHTLLVKGRHDVIAGAEMGVGVNDDVMTVRLNRTGNPGMTVGGTGDVLAGVVGAFAARTTPLSAAAAGAYANGLAGDAAAEKHGTGLVATDLIDHLPQAIANE